jgi:hypothetical protein
MALMCRVEELSTASFADNAVRLWIIVGIPTGWSAISANGAPRCVAKLRHDDKAVNVAAQEGLQELGIIPEGHASIRLAVWTQHVSMRQHAFASEHFTVVDRIEADGANAVE